MPDTPNLAFYRTLSKLPWPAGYVGKFLLVAFVGVHVPLISLISYVALVSGEWRTAIPVLLVALFATLGGTVVTLWLQWRLLAPVLRTAAALELYRETRTPPDLPTGFGDEAGVLMRTTQGCLTELDDLVGFKTSLLRMLAHDLRGMVTSCGLASELIGQELETPEPDLGELREWNGLVAASTDRQESLIRNVVGLSKWEAGRLDSTPSRTDVKELLERVARLLKVRADTKGVEVVRRVEGVGEVEVDGAKVQQILQNLADNALKFTPSGGRIELSVGRENGHLEFTVRDTGIGMSPAVREKLFEPFSPAHRKGTSSEDGTGLGLWICEILTGAQGGRLEVDSEEGEGTEVRLLLPA